MDTDGTSTYLDTVTYHIVGISTNLFWFCVEQGDVFVHRVGEWVVHSHQTAFFLAPFKHWELCNPQQGELVLVAQSQLVTHLQTQLT